VRSERFHVTDSSGTSLLGRTGFRAALQRCGGRRRARERLSYHTGKWVTPAVRAAQMRCWPMASRWPCTVV